MVHNTFKGRGVFTLVITIILICTIVLLSEKTFADEPVGACYIYDDHTFIINELVEDHDANVLKHGEAKWTFNYIPIGGGVSSKSSIPWQVDADARDYIKSVFFGSYTKPKTIKYWFDGCKNLEYFDGRNLDTSAVDGISRAFNQAGENAETFYADVTGWTFKKGCTMIKTFAYCAENAESFTIIGMDNWDTSGVTDMEEMFRSAGRYATNWSIGDLTNWNTSNVKYLNGLFRDCGTNCTNWSVGDFTRWDFSSAQFISRMLNGAFGIKDELYLDVRNMDFKNLNRIDGLFANLSRGTPKITIDCTGWDVSGITSIGCLFAMDDSSTEEILARREVTIIGLDTWDTSSVQSMNGLFYCVCGEGAKLDVYSPAGFDLSSISDLENMMGFTEATGSPVFDFGYLELPDREINIRNMFLHASHFSGVIELKLYYSKFGDSLRYAATAEDGDICLVCEENDSAELANILVSYYGEDSTCHGNVYTIDNKIDVTIPESISFRSAIGWSECKAAPITVRNNSNKDIYIKNMKYVDSEHLFLYYGESLLNNINFNPNLAIVAQSSQEIQLSGNMSFLPTEEQMTQEGKLILTFKVV